eukprot:12829750-Alexandrium_andersonii.AAC.1
MCIRDSSCHPRRPARAAGRRAGPERELGGAHQVEQRAQGVLRRQLAQLVLPAGVAVRRALGLLRRRPHGEPLGGGVPARLALRRRAPCAHLAGVRDQ